MSALPSPLPKLSPTRSEEVFYFVLGFVSGWLFPGRLYSMAAMLGVRHPGLMVRLIVRALVFVAVPLALRKRYPYYAKGIICYAIAAVLIFIVGVLSLGLAGT